MVLRKWCLVPTQSENQHGALCFLYHKFESLGLQEMLSSGWIQVSNGKEYALSDVIDTIKHAFGGSPQIVCKRGSIEELRLCFDKELKVSFPFFFT
jgi:ribonuclease T2